MLIKTCPCCGENNVDHLPEECPHREECCDICGLPSCESLEDDGTPCPERIA